MENKEEKKIAADIMNIVRKLGLPFKLDRITEGKENCFPLAIIAQCNRQEIYNELSSRGWGFFEARVLPMSESGAAKSKSG